MKIYKLHDHNRKFLMELSSLENCKKSAEKLYGTKDLGIIDAYQTEDGVNVINVEVIKGANNTLLH